MTVRNRGALIAGLLALIAPMAGAYLTDQDTQISYGMYFDVYPTAVCPTGQDTFLFVDIQSTALSDGIGWLVGQRLDAETGERSGNSFRVDDFNNYESTEHGPPHIAYSPRWDRYLVVWGATGSHNIYAQQVAGTPGGGDDDEELIGDRITICSDSSSDARNPRVAYDSEHHIFLVVWDDMRNSDAGGNHWDIYGQRVNAETGALLGGNFRITEAGEEAWWPDVAYSPIGDHFLVVWARRLGTGRTHRGQRVEYDGDLLGSAFDISQTDDTFYRRPGVCYWPGMSRFLVVYAEDDAMGQLVAGEAGGGDGGGQLIGGAQTLGRASLGSMFEVVFDAQHNLWLATWNYAGGQHYKRGCFVQSDGTPRVDEFAIDSGVYNAGINTVVPAHSINSDRTFLLHTTFEALESDVQIRTIPQPLSEAAQGEMEHCDLLSVDVDPSGWNMIGVRPIAGDDADMQIFPETRFFWGEFLAESDHGDPGRAEIIAVNGEATGAETLNLLLETTHIDTVYFRAEHAASQGTLTGPADVTRTLGTGDTFLHSWTLNIAEGEHRVINVIPSGDENFNLAVFETEEAVLGDHIGKDELDPIQYVSNATTPGRVETVYLVGQRTGTVGIAVWLGSGSGEYRLVVRDPDEPTTDEIVRYLLGLASKPWGGNVNGDMDGIWSIIDAADVVANIEAGR